MAQLNDTTINGSLIASDVVKAGSQVHAQSVELSDTAPYIDFHHDNSTLDYTARIIHSTKSTMETIVGQYGSIVQNGDSGYFHPAVEGKYGLGYDNYRWYSIHLQNSPNVSSLAELKENIRPFTTALEEIDKTDVFNYYLKSCIEREGEDIDHTGFVIGEGYNISELLLGHGGNGIDIYNAIGVTFGGVKELYEIVKEQAETIEQLNNKIEELKEKVG